MPWKTTIGGSQCPSGLVQVTISSKEVYLPEASNIGFDEEWARPGRWIVWQTEDDSHETSHGRVIGSIVDHNHPSEDLTGYLAIAVIDDRLSFVHVQYVNPRLVTSCSKVNAKYIAFILSIDFNEKTVNEIIRLQSNGYLNDRGYETAIQKLYCSCKDHGTYKADGKFITCPVCGGRTNETDR